MQDIGSTQVLARGLADKGAEEGTVVTAISQHNGTGRLGRRWHSPRGGLYMSIILRPLGSPRLEELSLMGSLAVVEGLRHILPIRLRIRWPNDVVAGEKKLAGVIVEGMTEGIDLTCAVVGIGVNCNAPAAKLGASIPATSLYEELGEKVDLIAVRSAVLGALSGLYTSWLAGDSMKPTWEANVGTLGRDVSIKLKTEENPFSCRAVGVQEDGKLVVEQGRRRFPVAAEDLERLTEL